MKIPRVRGPVLGAAGDERRNVFAVIARLDLGHRGRQPSRASQPEDHLQVRVLDQLLCAGLVEGRERRGQADPGDPIPQHLCDRERVRRATGVSGHNEGIEPERVRDRGGIGYPVQQAPVLPRRRPTHPRAVCGDQANPKRSGQRVVGMFAQPRIAGAVLEEHRNTVGISTHLVGHPPTARYFDHRHDASPSPNFRQDLLTRSLSGPRPESPIAPPRCRPMPARRRLCDPAAAAAATTESRQSGYKAPASMNGPVRHPARRQFRGADQTPDRLNQCTPDRDCPAD